MNDKQPVTPVALGPHMPIRSENRIEAASSAITHMVGCVYQGTRGTVDRRQSDDLDAYLHHFAWTVGVCAGE